MSVEFNEETNKEITKQLCNGNEPDDLRACWIELVYDTKNETLGFWDCALQEIDVETGEDIEDKPFGIGGMENDITLKFNQEEIDFIKENLDMIIEQIKENERTARETPYIESKWEDDYLR